MAVPYMYGTAAILTCRDCQAMAGTSGHYQDLRSSIGEKSYKIQIADAVRDSIQIELCKKLCR